MESLFLCHYIVSIEAYSVVGVGLIYKVWVKTKYDRFYITVTFFLGRLLNTHLHIARFHLYLGAGNKGVFFLAITLVLLVLCDYLHFLGKIRARSH